MRPGYVGVYRASTLCLNTGFAMQAWSSQYYGCVVMVIPAVFFVAAIMADTTGVEAGVEASGGGGGGGGGGNEAGAGAGAGAEKRSFLGLWMESFMAGADDGNIFIAKGTVATGAAGGTVGGTVGGTAAAEADAMKPAKRSFRARARSLSENFSKPNGPMTVPMNIQVQ